MSTPMRYVGLFSGAASDGQPTIKVATPAGVIRDVPMTRAQLVAIISDAARALHSLDQRVTR